MGFMPEQGIMLTTAVEQIIREHVPVEGTTGLIREKTCRGCGDHFSFMPRSEFPAHQAAVIAEWVKNSLGCR